MNKLREILRSVGPALIVAAVVLGPGSILTSSKVGASFGYSAIFVVLGATVLMIGMVALAARVGAIHEKTPCEELATRLGRPVAVFIGIVLFTLVAFFQSSNNLALIAGVEPLLGDENSSVAPKTQLAILVIINAAIIAILYMTRSLYKRVEALMKILIGMMVIAFLTNFVVAFMTPREAAVVASGAKPDILALLGMMGTTFSVGGAFYQAYLVKEKGWGLPKVRNALFDSVVSISVLGIITAVILATSARVFYGRAEPITLGSVGDVARQLEPLFGSSATIIFCGGIIAGAFSSFLVNAMIGGTVLADALGKGGRLDDRNRWADSPHHACPAGRHGHCCCHTSAWQGKYRQSDHSRPGDDRHRAPGSRRRTDLSGNAEGSDRRAQGAGMDPGSGSNRIPGRLWPGLAPRWHRQRPARSPGTRAGRTCYCAHPYQ